MKEGLVEQIVNASYTFSKFFLFALKGGLEEVQSNFSRALNDQVWLEMQIFIDIKNNISQVNTE